MNALIAQLVALACHGNAVLRGTESPAVFPGNSTCRFCESLRFLRVSRKLFGGFKETPVADTPEAWFAVLKEQGVGGLRVFRVGRAGMCANDRLSCLFIGGKDTWGLEALLPKGRSDFWLAKWELGDRAAPEQRIWRVNYGRITRSQRFTPPALTVAQAALELGEELERALAFAERQELSGFAKSFAEALDTLRSAGRTRHGYHRDLAPAGLLSVEAAGLLDACQKAWVFGGMGSWSDLGFAEPAEQTLYTALSGELLERLGVAIEVAVGSVWGE